MTPLKVSLAGIKISREDALELVNRMNESWPGKYWVTWEEAPYSNNALNPFFAQYHAQCSDDVGGSRNV